MPIYIININSSISQSKLHFITKKPFRINSANKLINFDNVDLLTENPLYVDTTSTKLFTYIPDSSKQINNSPKIYKTNISDVNFDNPKADFYDSYLFLPQYPLETRYFLPVRGLARNPSR